MTEHWHNVPADGALPLASSLLVALAWQSRTPRVERTLPVDRAGPEMPLQVSFEGLAAAEIGRAIRSFPGACRFRLSEDC